MKTRLGRWFAVIMALLLAVSGYASGVSDDDTFGDKLKRFFAGPSPTPSKRHKKPTPTPTPPAKPKKRSRSSKSRVEEPPRSPSPGASEETPSRPEPALPTENQTANSANRASPSPSSTPVPAVTEEIPEARSQYLEPVRPINPGPNGPRTPRPKPTARPAPMETPPPAKPIESPRAAPTQTPIVKKPVSPSATFSTAELVGSENYSPAVTKIVDVSMGLTNRNLSYKYNSADPVKGGMDSSGFVQYVLTQAGIKDVPRDARDQYIWVRKAGNFQAVLSQKDDSFELDALKPGDLLFWATPFSVSKEPDIIQTMVYLGRDKSTNQRLMVGATERHPFRGQMRSGVNVFDFKVARPKSEKEANAVFVGYARIPGLSGE